MRLVSSTSILALLALPLLHCMLPVPQQPGQAVADPTAGTSETSGAGGGAAAPPARAPGLSPASKSGGASEATRASVPTTVEVHSDCAKTTPVFYGDKPKFGSGTKSSIGSNTTTSASRKSDGSLTIWIIDDQENGIASVHVDPTTKRVEIDRSCKQITAR